MQHVHASSIRPDRVYKTGVIAPYAVGYGPGNIARNVLSNFIRSVRPIGPTLRGEMQPEEIASRAKRVADAMARGIKPPKATDPRLMQAARMILQGRSFRIHSAGRSALVRATSPSSWAALNQRNPAYYAPR